MSGDGMVILSEIWDPGWKVTIDGEAAELIALIFSYGVWQSQLVRYHPDRYKPVQLVVTSWVTGIGWVIVVLGYGALGAGSLLSRRRGKNGRIANSFFRQRPSEVILTTRAVKRPEEVWSPALFCLYLHRSDCMSARERSGRSPHHRLMTG